jgi:hypothetical protein
MADDPTAPSAPAWDAGVPGAVGDKGAPEPARGPYDAAEREFEELAEAVHLPFLDRKLIRKYFLSERTAGHLTGLLAVVAALRDHKDQTLTLLKAVFEREQILHAMKAMVADFGSGRLTALEVQTKVLQLLYGLQRVTLRIVEGVQAWRAGLTRPFAFEWRGANYLLRILADGKALDACAVSQVLPLQLGTYPLCSNLTALCLFGPGGCGGPRGPDAAGQQAVLSITYPMKASKKGLLKQVPPELQQRLQRAEVVLFAESGTQGTLLQDLQALQASGAFVTLLDLRPLIPNCADGVPLANPAWDRQLNRALVAAAARLRAAAPEPPPPPPATPAPSAAGGGAVGAAAAASSPERGATVEAAAPPPSDGEDDDDDAASEPIPGGRIARPASEDPDGPAPAPDTGFSDLEESAALSTREPTSELILSVLRKPMT